MENLYKSNSFLSFTLSGEYFAANVAKVINILEMVKITKVPQSPNYVLGVINLRGSALPLIDLRTKFGMKQVEDTSNTCILVLDIEIENELLQMGARVDSVKAVLEINSDNIQPPPSIGSKYQSEYIYGMSMYSEEFIMLLDMDKVFSTDEILELKKSSEKIENKKSFKLEKVN
ncbi:MAG: chemotaxis protein CheW [Bacteroidales bacterium]|nr:chemotaxis protein CheW [Bacteroidales bacterium]